MPNSTTTPLHLHFLLPLNRNLPLFLFFSNHTMEAQVHKEQEEELLIQTHALKIDNREELSPEQQEKEDTTNNKDYLPPPPLYEVEAILGYEFNNKHLLEEAFTHSSYGAENDFSYERLEYLGDAVLNLLVANEHFFSYPNLKPKILTPLRSKNVDSEKLARVAIKHGLDRYLRHKKPQLGEQVSIYWLINFSIFCSFFLGYPFFCRLGQGSR